MEMNMKGAAESAHYNQERFMDFQEWLFTVKFPEYEASELWEEFERWEDSQSTNSKQ